MNRFLASTLSFCLLFSTVALKAATNATAPQPTASATATPPPASSSLSPSPSPSVGTNPPVLVVHDLPEIHGKISLPKEWTLLPGKLLEGDMLLATREKISGENDVWNTGLSMTIDRNGAKDSGQKANDYALSLAREAREKAGEEASPIREAQSGSFHEFRFDFSPSSDPPIQITEVLRANDKTGMLAVILWQVPKEESARLQGLREAVLAGLKLDSTQ
jgi:hypothetical protein